MIYTYLCSPFGQLLLAGDGGALTHIVFPGGKKTHRPGDGWRRDDRAALLVAAGAQLEAYFAGERFEFELDLAPRGTPFQRRVWDGLRRIPYARTWSYGELARALGRPTAARAVGAANGANPLPIVVPCHRVIGADGSLTGFSGGLALKRQLLALETTRGGVQRCLPGLAPRPAPASGPV